MNILNLEVGQRARVINIEGRKAERRLYEIGIMPGIELQLITRHPFKGPLVFKIGSASIALGRSIAAKIMVKLV